MRDTEEPSPGPAARCWKYGRYCCCRYGFYPLAVAPVLTAACLMSLYSSTGCQFVDVDIGFTPEPNVTWNATSTSLGFWYRYIPGDDTIGDHKYDPELLDSVHDSCQWYSDEFEDNYVENDRTWKVARIMAIVAGSGSLASAVLAWSFVGPFFCPVSFLWPGILLPLVMISFVAECSKFLFFDMGICRNAVFEDAAQEGVTLQPAESCSLGDSAILGIIASGLLLVSLLLVCLNVPEQRRLDPHFGLPNGDTDPSEEDTEDFRRQQVSPSKVANGSKKSKKEQPVIDEERPPERDETSEYSSDFYEDELNSFGAFPPVTSIKEEEHIPVDAESNYNTNSNDASQSSKKSSRYKKQMQQQRIDEEDPSRDELSEFTDEFYDEGMNGFGFPPSAQTKINQSRSREPDPDNSFASQSSSKKKELPQKNDTSLIKANVLDTSIASASSRASSSKAKNSRHRSMDELLGSVVRDAEDDLEEEANITFSSIAPEDQEVRISESRLSTLASVEQKAAGSASATVATNMLEDLVRDLNSSYSYPHYGGRESPALSVGQSQYS